MTRLSLIQQKQAVRDDLAAMFRLTAHFGWDDTVWNHITARVPGDEEHFYMHRFGLHYSEVTASNLITVDKDGNVIDGPKDVNTTGFIIHSAVHLNHPDKKFVFHTHPQSAIAATCFHELPLYVQDSAMFYGKIGYHDWEGISLNLEERARIAKALSGNIALIMRNHGMLTVGESAGECFMNMYYLIRTCEVAVQVSAAQTDLVKPPAQMWQEAREQYKTFPPGQYEWPALKRLCERLFPTYKD